MVLYASPGYAYIDGVSVSNMNGNVVSIWVIPLKKGQVFKGVESTAAYARHKVYGIKQY